MDNGFRPGMKEKLMKEGLTKAEIERIEEQRKFDSLKPNTYAYNIAVYLDSLRRQFREEDILLTKRLWNIENILNNIKRCKVQIASGKITEEIKDGLTMNETELKTQIKHNEWLALGEARSIPETLSRIRAIVGHKDVVGKVIMTEEQFEDYVIGIEKRLKELGYELFS